MEAERERMNAPREPPQQIRLHAARGLARDRALPVRLVLEHSREVANDVDHAEDQPVLRAHRHVRPVRVAGDRGRRRRGLQKLVHARGRADLGGGRVDGEDEGEDDGEEDGRVGAVGICEMTSVSNHG